MPPQSRYRARPRVHRQAMRSLTSLHESRVYSPENFWSPVQKDFCNNIGTKRTYEIPAGRPRGALNRATVLAQELLSARVESIAGKLIELAEGGDMRAIRVCMDGLVPAIKDQPIAVELPPIEKPADSVEAVASIAA